MSQQDETSPDGPDTALDDGGEVVSRDDGQLHFEAGTEDWVFPVTAPTDVTPLSEDEPEATIPPSPLWAMKDRRHAGTFHIFGHPERIRVQIGQGDEAIYAIDDGKHHCMIGHRVGATTDGTVYSLVAHITKESFDALLAGDLSTKDAFLGSSEAGLSGTVEATGLATVFDVDWYDTPADIPGRYLPGTPFIKFPADLPTAER